MNCDILGNKIVYTINSPKYNHHILYHEMLKGEKTKVILRKRMMIVMLMFIAVLNACGDDSTVEHIYEHLEETVVLEEDFHTYKDEITALEKKEQDIYEQIIDLTAEEFEQIKQLATEALETIEQRSNHLDKEQESIQASEKEFEKIKPLIDELTEDDVKNKANEMYDVMMERYRAYDDLYEVYKQSLELEKELYTLLKDEDTIQKEVTNQVADINEKYNEIHEAVDAFSLYTTQYNELKKGFYEVAQLNVVFDED